MKILDEKTDFKKNSLLLFKDHGFYFYAVIFTAFAGGHTSILLPVSGVEGQIEVLRHREIVRSSACLRVR